MIDLATLNDGQLEAVHAPVDHPVLVIAGAGSGKTTTLTARLEHVVDIAGVDPTSVVAMTFTRKAAGEFAERLAGGPAAAVWSGTIHSFAYARLRAYREACGEPAFEVLAHPKPHVRRLIGRPSDGYEEAVSNAPELDLSSVLGHIGAWQNELVDPKLAMETADDFIEVWAARIYDAYTRWKRNRLKVDFGDMLGLCIDAYEADPVFLHGDRDRFPFGLVDELQDTNTAQWRLAHMLWERQPLFGVGDPRQAIYEWRGARPSQLLRFADLWPGVEIIRLVDNYRSTPEIINIAETLMAGTEEASASGRLRPNRPHGEPPEIVPVSDTRIEAKEIADQIKDLIDPSGPIDMRNVAGLFPFKPGSISVLYRTNAQSADLEDELARLEIPYQVVGSKGFWARKEITQLLSYLQLATNPHDHDAFAQAVTAPARYLGRAFVDAARELAQDRNWPIVEACAHVTGYSGRTLTRGQADNAADFTSLIGSLSKMTPHDALDFILRTTDFRAWLRRNEGTADDADDDRLDVIDKLIEQAEQHDTHDGLLAHAERMRSKASSGSKPDPMRVQLMTIHRAKGLEWPIVYIAGFCEGLLPHYKGNPLEERRLAYVAMTRARDLLTLFSPLMTFRGETGISEFAIDAGLVTPTDAAIGVET